MNRFFVPDVRWPDDIPPPPYRALARLDKLIEEGEEILAKLKRDGALPHQALRLLSLQHQALIELGRVATAILTDCEQVPSEGGN